MCAASVEKKNKNNNTKSGNAGKKGRRCNSRMQTLKEQEIQIQNTVSREKGVL